VKFRVLATLAVLLLSAPSALGVQRALAPTRGELAGWLAAAGIELAYLSLAFATFADQRRQRLASRVARAAVFTAIVLNVIADYAARVPDGLSGAAAFTETFDWLLLTLSVLESAPLATLAYTIATLLHSSAQHTAAGQQHQQHTAAGQQHMLQHTADAGQHTAEHPAADAAVQQQHQQQYTAAGQHMLQHRQHQQRAALAYRCPRCAAALTQQQYGAARRYGHCAGCKRK